jgi:hypothetical protein
VIPYGLRIAEQLGMKGRDMNDYHIEQDGSMPGFSTFVSHLKAFPLAISFPSRLEQVNFPIGLDYSLCVEFGPRQQYPIAVTRWVLEWRDNVIYFNDYLEGKADFVWLAKREMDYGKGSQYYPYERYEFPDKTGGLFPKPKPSSISPALSGTVRVIYWKHGTRHPGQRIFCQRPGDPRNIFWSVLLEPDVEVTDGEFGQVLTSLRWL